MSEVNKSLSLADSGASGMRPFTRLLAVSGLLFLFFSVIGEPTFQPMTALVISLFLLGSASVVQMAGADRDRPGVPVSHPP